MVHAGELPENINEVLDVLIGEIALTRRRLESLIEVLEEKGHISEAEFKNKLKEKSEEEKLQTLVTSLSEKK
ncbi:MAG: hypothetical protein D6733_07265 [Methanobacteriota archaeon]|nr:MAG: hypothetical protein D6733_07265 [Euryarchaeota archaeon]